jgi:hypothetical protein
MSPPLDPVRRSPSRLEGGDIGKAVGLTATLNQGGVIWGRRKYKYMY